MKLIFIGPQGSGKGTQAFRLKEKLNIPHISTGDIFRENIKNNTELGIEAQKYMNEGKLVPDELVIRLIKDRLSQDDAKTGFILDGFPRNTEQAKALSEATDIDKVVLIDLDDATAIERIGGRRTCKKCGTVYHVKFNPPKEEGKCDEDGEELIQRDDDKEEAIKKRLEIYHKETQPISDFYKEQGILISVDGSKSIDDVEKDINKKLGL